MKRQWIGFVSAIVALLVLSACANSAGDVVDLGLIVDGKTVDNKELDLEVVFSDVFGKDASDDKRAVLKKALKALDEGKTDRPDIEALRGLSGLSAAELAQKVLFPDQERRVTGLIGDYYYEEKTARGHLTFDLITEIGQGPAKRTIRRQWHIDVLGEPDDQEGFKKVRRVEEPGPDGLYFPGTIKLPDYARSRFNPYGIWVRGLDHKLFAIGKSVKVTAIYEQINDGDVRRLPNTDPLYKQTSWTCIDLLTKGTPPAFRVDPVFRYQSAYCLGGCRMGAEGKRFIINSM
jgi:hypothetical protein